MEAAMSQPADRGTLSDRDRAILDFERQWWRYPGTKEQAVRRLFDLPATRYYQVLNALIDQPEAMAYDPMLVKRLRRLRAARRRDRAPETTADESQPATGGVPS